MAGATSIVTAAKPSVLAPEDLRAADGCDWRRIAGGAVSQPALTRVAGLNALDRVNANGGVFRIRHGDNALLSMPHRVLTSDLNGLRGGAPTGSAVGLW